MAQLLNPFIQKHFDRPYVKSRAEGAYITAYVFAAAAGHRAPSASTFQLHDEERIAKLTHFAEQLTAALRRQR